MAIQTVTNANLAEFVAKRAELGTEIKETAPPATETKPVAENGTSLSEAPDPGKQEPSAKSNPVQPRINELTREKKEAEEFAEEEYNKRVLAERRIGDLETEVAQLKAAQTPAPKVVVEEEPKPDQFPDYIAYSKALSKWEAKQAVETYKQDQAEAEQKRLIAAQQELMRARVQQAMKDIPDFVEVITAAQDIEIPGYIQGAMEESELGPQLGYYLAKNEDEAKRILALPPAKSLLELGKIELKLAKAPEPEPTKKPPETTRAPAPISAVSTTGESPIPTDLSKPMPFAEYRAKRREELRRKKH